MASPVKLYQSEMHDNLGLFATWLPGEMIEVGDAGILQDGRFRRVMSLGELDIPADVADTPVQHEIQYTSSHGTEISLAGGGGLATVANVEIAIRFSTGGAFVFQASGLRQLRLNNRAAVATELLNAYRAGRWDRKWLLVESTYTAKRATVVVSQDSSAGLVLSADAAGATISSLADPRIGFAVTSTHGKLVHLVGAKDLRPLYTCLRVSDPFLGTLSVQPVRGAADLSPEAAFTRPAIADLLES